MADPDEPVEGLVSMPDKRYERLATKILTHFWKLESTYFAMQIVIISTSL